MSDVRKKLSAVDWSFPGSSSGLDTVHSLHWFPGNYIHQIPSFLIQLLSRPGDLVCDPFCGSGTTGVEAVKLGRRSWQSDSNRASIQVAEGKMIAATRPDLRPRIEDILGDLLLAPALVSRRDSTPRRQHNQELLSWFHPGTLDQLTYLWDLVQCEDDILLRALLEMIFTDTLFACASAPGALTSTGKRRRHHWGWIADNVRPKCCTPHGAAALYRDKLHHAAEITVSATSIPPDCSTICRGDSRRLTLPDELVDLVVTSPPYIGMIDYTLANRLTYLWMDWPLDEDRQVEIGSRRNRNRKSALLEYEQAIQASALEISRVLKPGHCCAIVIGASRIHPQAVDRSISCFGETLQLFWGPHSRTPSRRRVSDRKGSSSVEHICVFQKTGL